MGKKLTDKQIKQQYEAENFASLLKFQGARMQERWFTSELDNVCPICTTLASFGWLDYGLLPKFKKAHSVIGQGDWKAPDSSCNCVKGYRRIAGEKPEGIIPLSGFDGDNPVDNPTLQFKKFVKTLDWSKCTCAAGKISFDYDGVLSTDRGKALAKEYISSGAAVYIISARSDKEGMLATAKELGIPADNVYATGSNSAKEEKVKLLGISKHIDNNPDVIKALGDIGKLF